MATQAQLEEKVRQDRAGVSSSAALEGLATEAQLAEKLQQDHAGNDRLPTRQSAEDAMSQDHSGTSTFATPSQLAEKLRQDRAGAQFATPVQLAEKTKSQDQTTTFATSAQLEEKSRGRPPPLPPRAPSAHPQPPPAYSADDAKRSHLISEQWRSRDPRSSSTHSLVPVESQRDGRRTLLLVFIHGFMGNETSFQSFPAHIHNLLSITLAETHVVHTKIYPRYQSRKAIDFARDDFSEWLEPHEDAHTEVVLLGHSMGGILCADVALQKPITPSTGMALRHRILGTINFDTPFLGMHPGVIVSGIGSLFRPAPEPPGAKPAASSSNRTDTPSISQAGGSSYAPSTVDSDNQSQLSLVQSITSPLASPPPKDPFFNAPFPNDKRLPERKGWNNLLHFINKHSDGLTSATKQYFMSHLEFGGCLADYPGLKIRYERIRALEDVNDLAQASDPGQATKQRVRFVNYYTASTGRPKQPKIPPGHILDEDGNVKPIEAEMQDLSVHSTRSHSPATTPSISVGEQAAGSSTSQPSEEPADPSPIEAQMQNLGENSGVHDEVQEMAPMRHIDSMPIEDDEELPEQLILATTEEETTEDPTIDIQPSKTEPPLPPLPPIPTEPEAIDLDVYIDKDSRKIAEKEYKRVTKAYQQAVKDRESALKDRTKLIEKREKKALQDREKELKAQEKRAKQERQKELKASERQRLIDEKEEEKRKATINPEPPRTRQGSVASSVSVSRKDDKPKRDRKFCMLPPEYGGKRDKCWVRVYMEGVDEVGAHCGLFFPGPQYESLVGDVGRRIGRWVEEDGDRGALLDALRD